MNDKDLDIQLDSKNMAEAKVFLNFVTNMEYEDYSYFEHFLRGVEYGLALAKANKKMIQQGKEKL